jgi:hypothetical protein
MWWWSSRERTVGLFEPRVARSDHLDPRDLVGDPAGVDLDAAHRRRRPSRLREIALESNDAAGALVPDLLAADVGAANVALEGSMRRPSSRASSFDRG